MFRDDYNPLPKEPVNILFDWGGLGDLIAASPCIKFIRDTYKHVDLHVYVPDYFLELGKHLVPNVIMRPFKEGKQTWNKSFHCRKISNDHHTNMRSHLVDNAFHILADTQPDIQYKNYVPLRLDKIDIKRFDLPDKYVIITTGFTAEVREMKAETVNELSRYVKLKGYQVIFLGNRHTKATEVNPVHDIVGNFNKEIDYTQGLDLIDKTTLLEAGKIIAGAKCLIGLDNGLMHLAGCTETSIVGGFTTVEPKFRMPYRHNQMGWNCYPVVPDETLKCRFCQSNWEYIFGHKFTKCYYKEKGLDTEIKCTKNLTADKYIKHLETIL